MYSFFIALNKKKKLFYFNAKQIEIPVELKKMEEKDLFIKTNWFSLFFVKRENSNRNIELNGFETI